MNPATDSDCTSYKFSPTKHLQLFKRSNRAASWFARIPHITAAAENIWRHRDTHILKTVQDSEMVTMGD